MFSGKSEDSSPEIALSSPANCDFDLYRLRVRAVRGPEHPENFPQVQTLTSHALLSVRLCG